MKSIIITLLFILLVQTDSHSVEKKESISTLVTADLYSIVKPKHKSIARKKGSYTISSMFRDDGEIEWARRFDIAELGGVDDVHVKHKTLEKKGVFDIKYHIGYDWMPAFYYYTSGKNRNYVSWLYEHKKTTTLNPNGPFLHCEKNGYNWCKEYYYNFGNPEVFKSKIDDLLSNMKNKGFNGLFFDWASGGFIERKEYSRVKEYFEKLNPNKNYFDLVADFYKELKRRGVFVVTNQAFRKEKYHFLRYVTYDMTESYITTVKHLEKKIQIAGVGWVKRIETTNYYPIYRNSKTIKDSLHFIDMLTNYRKKYKKYGFKNFIYLNYLAPEYERLYDSMPLYSLKKPRNAIYFGYAMAKLADSVVYGEISNHRELERDDVYFYDLGKPLGDSYKKLHALNAYVRFYTKGFVLVSGAYKEDRYIRLKSDFIPKNKEIYDAYDKVWLKSGKHDIVIKLRYQKDTFSEKFFPAGRVYLYNQN